MSESRRRSPVFVLCAFSAAGSASCSASDPRLAAPSAASSSSQAIAPAPSGRASGSPPAARPATDASDFEPPLPTEGHAFRAKGTIGDLTIDGSCDTFGPTSFDNGKVLSKDFDQATISCRFPELEMVFSIDFFEASSLPDVARAMGRVRVGSSGSVWCGISSERSDVKSSLLVSAFDMRTGHIAGSFDLAWSGLATVQGCATGHVRGAFDLTLDPPARRAWGP